MTWGRKRQQSIRHSESQASAASMCMKLHQNTISLRLKNIWRDVVIRGMDASPCKNNKLNSGYQLILLSTEPLLSTEDISYLNFLKIIISKQNRRGLKE
jgi:hypothetical protein